MPKYTRGHHSIAAKRLNHRLGRVQAPYHAGYRYLKDLVMKHKLKENQERYMKRGRAFFLMRTGYTPTFVAGFSNVGQDIAVVYFHTGGQPGGEAMFFDSSDIL